MTLRDEVTRRIVGWNLSSHLIREILDGLDALAASPNRHLIRIGSPVELLQFDVVARDPGPPPRDYLFTFTVRFAADEETLFVVDCHVYSEERPAPE